MKYFVQVAPPSGLNINGVANLQCCRCLALPLQSVYVEKEKEKSNLNTFLCCVSLPLFIYEYTVIYFGCFYKSDLSLSQCILNSAKITKITSITYAPNLRIIQKQKLFSSFVSAIT